MMGNGRKDDTARLGARALARWEGEGGALGYLQDEGGSLDEFELGVLTRLGAGVLGEWGRLPSDSQRAIFQRASIPQPLGDAVRLKFDIARFLDDHNDQ